MNVLYLLSTSLQQIHAPQLSPKVPPFASPFVKNITSGLQRPAASKGESPHMPMLARTGETVPESNSGTAVTKYLARDWLVLFAL